MQVQYVVHGATLQGVEAIPVDVEVLVSSGLPSFSIVGMPDAAIQEARERVRAAIRACGFTMPSQKLVVNLAPGSIRKSGSGFDLPIAVGILAATNQIPREELDRALLVGELSLEGHVRPVTGLLAYGICAQAAGLDLICAQPDDGLIALKGLVQLTIKSLSALKQKVFSPARMSKIEKEGDALDFADIAGHDSAKRALQLAAAGGHGLVMVGPPGSGKTMLASRLPSILPPLSEQEKIETALVHSVVGLDMRGTLAGIRPFRKPHHSISTAGLIGGGRGPRPGEATLAHNGVLFLDELPEFKPSTLQSIRQPLESGKISIVRAEGKIEFPSRFMLIAASNPCPCGHYGDKDIRCTCSETQIRTYQNRIGGPLMDRIDIHIDVWRSDARHVLKSGSGQSSSVLREGVMRAREYAAYRKKDQHLPIVRSNTAQLLVECNLNTSDKEFFEEIAQTYHLSGRGIMRTLALSRTIADIEQQEKVSRVHLSEALGFRMHEESGEFRL